MNHYVGLIENDEDAAFVDMAVGIGICGIMRDVFMQGGGELVSSLPTIGLVAIGAVLAGIVAAAIEKIWQKQEAKQENRTWHEYKRRRAFKRKSISLKGV